MTTMIERVAEAIYAAEENQTKPKGGDWRPMTLSDEDEKIRGMYLAYARAAIIAMCEPTEAMIGAAEQRAREVCAHLEIAPGSIWEEMIGAALDDRR
ncbi:hypothetical protein [Azorhizobium doebereinerae]|uniref:hypothetical protein n=1 Tax=Azorhizobium doebereinerae TaxID=281091 RepID=UPI00048DF971|nr:hypothetical protein [Azorhizobium doebereinerae]